MPQFTVKATVTLDVTAPDEASARRVVFDMLSSAKSSTRKRKGSESPTAGVVGVCIDPPAQQNSVYDGQVPASAIGDVLE